MAKTSFCSTGSPRFLRSSATVPSSLTDTRAIRPAAGVIDPGTVIRRARLAGWAATRLICASAICSFVSLISCFSVPAAVGVGAPDASAFSWAAPGVDASPNVLRNDCGKLGQRLTLATPRAKTTIKREERPTMDLRPVIVTALPREGLCRLCLEGDHFANTVRKHGSMSSPNVCMETQLHRRSRGRRERCGTTSVKRNDVEASSDPKARTIAGRPVGRPRLAHAGDTRRSLHSVGFDALATFVMTLADVEDVECQGRRVHRRDDGRRIAKAPDGRVACAIHIIIVVVCIHAVVYVPDATLVAVYMDIAGQAPVKMSWAVQHNCRIAHQADRRQRLRYGDDGGLLHEKQHGEQHGAADAKLQTWMRARRHPAVLGHRWAHNKRGNGRRGLAPDRRTDHQDRLIARPRLAGRSIPSPGEPA